MNRVLHRRLRTGFTLVELLVVMAIIALLAGLLIAFFPSLASQNAEANAAANLQGWFNIARQRAIRNQNPYGVRLWVSSATNGAFTNLQLLQVTDCQYIEQPDDFTGGFISTNAAAATKVTIRGADPTGGFADPTLYPVSPFGTDYLEVMGSGLMHKITGVTVNSFTLSTPIQFQISSAPNANPVYNGTSHYRVLRAARPIGEETMAFANGVVVDLNTNYMTNPSTNANNPWGWSNALPLTPVSTANGGATTGAYVDVLFGPSGAVVTPGVSQPTLNFWVRSVDPADINKPAEQQNIYYGTPSLIVVTTSTGAVGAYTPLQPPNAYGDIH